MRPPRNVSPAAARRRSLLLDVVLGVLIGLCAIVVAAGIGVVGFFALLCLLVIAPWYLIEGGLRAAGHRLDRGETTAGSLHATQPAAESGSGPAGEDRGGETAGDPDLRMDDRIERRRGDEEGEDVADRRRRRTAGAARRAAGGGTFAALA
ncbi:MAG: hypothetical protein J0H06_07230, partial [Actinobacteria bacterium]|nr:hypothetical protein [Actinomycetota bacterium]